MLPSSACTISLFDPKVWNVSNSNPFKSHTPLAGSVVLCGAYIENINEPSEADGTISIGEFELIVISRFS